MEAHFGLNEQESCESLIERRNRALTNLLSVHHNLALTISSSYTGASSRELSSHQTTAKIDMDNDNSPPNALDDAPVTRDDAIIMLRHEDADVLKHYLSLTDVAKHINTVGDDGRSPLHYAIFHKYVT